MTVKPSVAQAAMIGNPVSMPRVIQLVAQYNLLAGDQRVFFVEVTEQDIMDWELTANRNGHIACTHGGESLAGLVAALNKGIVEDSEVAVIDSTAHALKFAGFQEMYFEQRFPADFNIQPDPAMINTPVFVRPADLKKVPAPGRPLSGNDLDRFVDRTAEEIADILGLRKKN
jgi:threonine synthase